MTLNPAMFSSATDLHATPWDFFHRYNDEFNFGLDVCAIQGNAKCEHYYSPERDGLKQNWADDVLAIGGAVWMNPPYGRQIGAWVEKAYEESEKGATVVCLLPARTDTAWFQDYVIPVLEGAKPGRVEFIRGRLKFGDAKNSAPFPSVVVVFQGRDNA